MFDPLYEEIITNSSDLMIYMVQHVFIELLLPLSSFELLMLIMLVNWNWIPVSGIELEIIPCHQEVKKHLFEKVNFLSFLSFFQINKFKYKMI